MFLLLIGLIGNFVKIHLEDLNVEGKIKLGKGTVKGDLITDHEGLKESRGLLLLFL